MTSWSQAAGIVALKMAARARAEAQKVLPLGSQTSRCPSADRAKPITSPNTVSGSPPPDPRIQCSLVTCHELQ